MNKKRTNLIVAILNLLIAIIGTVVYFVNNYGSIFDNIKNFESIQILIVVATAIIGIMNIVYAIQNRKDKKVFFSQLIFGCSTIISAIFFGFDSMQWGIVTLSVINIVSITLQFVFIHLQNENTEESKKRRVTNIICIAIQLLMIVGIIVFIIVSILITSIRKSNIEKGLKELCNSISTLKGAQTSTVFIPVENDNKYGYISEDGKEKIACEYDAVSHFGKTTINNNEYYIALAKKDNKFYIISKSNDKIEINEYVQDELKRMEKEMKHRK